MLHHIINEKPSYAQDSKVAFPPQNRPPLNTLQPDLPRRSAPGLRAGYHSTHSSRSHPLLCFFTLEVWPWWLCTSAFQSLNATHRKQRCPALAWLILCMSAFVTWRFTFMNVCHGLNAEAINKTGIIWERCKCCHLDQIQNTINVQTHSETWINDCQWLAVLGHMRNLRFCKLSSKVWLVSGLH